jgi:hypothetical protein
MSLSVVGTPASTTFSGSGSITANSTPIVGDGVIIMLAGNGGQGFASVVDNQGGGTANIFTRVIRQFDSGGSGFHASAEIWYCPSIVSASGTYTVTATSNNPGSGAGCAAGFIECNAALTADVPGSLADTSGANTSLTVINGTANSVANEIAIAHIGLTSTVAGEFSVGPSSGYTNVVVTSSGAQGFATSGGYKILSAVETTQASWSWTTATWCAGVVATFKGPLIVAQSLSPMYYRRNVLYYV